MRGKPNPVVDQLRLLPGLAGCSEAELSDLAARGHVVTVPQGWAIIPEGTPGDSCYLILAGEVRILRGGDELARLGPGRLVGEVAVVEHKLRTATVAAASPLALMRFEAEGFEAWLDKRPQLRDALLSVAGSSGDAPTAH